MKKTFLLIIFFLILFLVPVAEANLQETLDLERNNLENLIPAERIGIALPIIFELKTIEGEDLFVRVDDDGRIFLLNNANPDLVVIGKKENLEKFLEITKEKELIENLNQISIEAVSFKGKVAVAIAENFLNVDLMQKKSFSQRFISLFIKPVIKVTGFFVSYFR